MDFFAYMYFSGTFRSFFVLSIFYLFPVSFHQKEKKDRKSFFYYKHRNFKANRFRLRTILLPFSFTVFFGKTSNLTHESNYLSMMILNDFRVQTKNAKIVACPFQSTKDSILTTSPEGTIFICTCASSAIALFVF